MSHGRIRVLQILETIFERIEQFAGRMRERCAVCPDCGVNRYTGPACVTFAEHFDTTPGPRR